jgi:hypothetical protein
MNAMGIMSPLIFWGGMYGTVGSGSVIGSSLKEFIARMGSFMVPMRRGNLKLHAIYTILFLSHLETKWSKSLLADLKGEVELPMTYHHIEMCESRNISPKGLGIVNLRCVRTCTHRLFKKGITIYVELLVSVAVSVFIYVYLHLYIVLAPTISNWWELFK